MNLVAVVRHFEVIENKLLHFLEQIGYGYGLLEITLEKLLLEGIVGIVIDVLDLALEASVDIELTHGLDFGQVGDHRVQVDLRFFLVLEEPMFYECY